jgi:hypothetical protein
MKFKLSLIGSKCNEYPRLTILHNQQVVYSGLIVDSAEVEVDVTLDTQEVNLITLQGIDKSQGVNGKWDTQLNKDGQIVADKWLTINNIWIDDISMGPEWVRSLTLVNGTGKQLFLSKTWWDNGSIEFSIQMPLLDWIIQEKFIKVEQNVIVAHDARSGERKFDYAYIQEKIKDIQKIIND